MVRVAIVEDRAEEGDVLEAHLSRYGQENDFVFDVVRYATAFDFVDDGAKYHLIFMDIDMPGISGMEAAQELRAHGVESPLVFVTSLAQYAIRGYSVDAIDFMVKPVSYQSFSSRMVRIMRAVNSAVAHTVTIKTREGTHAVSLDGLEFVEVTGHYLLYHLRGREDPLQARGTMTTAERELSSFPFARISNSHLVNMAHIQLVDADSVVLNSGTRLYFSRARRKAATEAITNYLCGGF